MRTSNLLGSKRSTVPVPGTRYKYRYKYPYRYLPVGTLTVDSFTTDGRFIRREDSRSHSACGMRSASHHEYEYWENDAGSIHRGRFCKQESCDYYSTSSSYY